MVALQISLQTLVYDILPANTARNDYTIGLENLFNLVVTLQETTQIIAYQAFLS